MEPSCTSLHHLGFNFGNKFRRTAAPSWWMTCAFQTGWNLFCKVGTDRPNAKNDQNVEKYSKTFFATAAVALSVKHPGIRFLRCNWNGVSLIPGRGIGVRKNPSCIIYEANVAVSVWFGKLMKELFSYLALFSVRGLFGSGCSTAVELTPWEQKLERSGVRIPPVSVLFSYSLLSFHFLTFLTS